MDTGVIDENIKTAEVINGLLDCVSNLRRVGDIGFEKYTLRAKFLNFHNVWRGNIGLVIFAAKGCLSLIYDRDTRALMGELKCDAAPDT